MSHIAYNLNQIQELINQHDSAKRVKLIAVSKTFPIEDIQIAYELGMRRFGENYPQELATKGQQLTQNDIEWHFIGNIQSNKTKLISEYANWVHTLTKASHATRLNDQRPPHAPTLQVLIEVNISNEDNKHGIRNLTELTELANHINQLPNLKLRGLMGMASDSSDEALINSQFKYLHECYEYLNQNGFELTELSMGMSNDFPLAIANGATMVRIGSKIFGARDYGN